MNCWVNLHRCFIGIFVSNVLIHIKQITIFFSYEIFPFFFNCFLKVKIDRKTSWSNSSSFITNFFSSSTSNISWNQITKSGVYSFKIIISFFFWNFCWFSLIVFLFRNPHSPVISKTFTH